MATIQSLKVNIEVSINGAKVKRWKWRIALLCFLAGLLGVPLHRPKVTA